MKRFVSFVFGALILVQGVRAAPVVFMDAAPDSTYTSWRNAALTDAADGSYVNMQNGAFPGTTNTSPLDAITSASLPHGGNWIQWIVFVPGETISSLTGRLQARIVFDWDGVDYDWDYNPAGANLGWYYFTSEWQDNAGGVTGTFGTSYPVPQPGFPTVADMVDEVTQYQTYWRGEVRILPGEQGEPGSYEAAAGVTSSAITAVPVPLAAPAGMAILAGIIAVRRVRRSN